LNLEESICIGSGIDVLVGACLQGIIDSTFYGPSVECRSYRRSNNQLSHCITCVIASVNVNGLGKFKSKLLTLSLNHH
jgi:hypothetical protein